MRLSRRTRLLTLWIACLAVWLGTLTPTVSQAMGSWTEMCTATGVRWVNTREPAGPSTPAGTAHLLGHCPLCGLHHPSLGLPPAHLGALPPVPLRFAVPRLFLAAPRTLFVWLSAPARGPPAALG